MSPPYFPVPLFATRAPSATRASLSDERARPRFAPVTGTRRIRSLSRIWSAACLTSSARSSSRPRSTRRASNRCSASSRPRAATRSSSSTVRERAARFRLGPREIEPARSRLLSPSRRALPIQPILESDAARIAQGAGRSRASTHRHGRRARTPGTRRGITRRRGARQRELDGRAAAFFRRHPVGHCSLCAPSVLAAPPNPSLYRALSASGDETPHRGRFFVAVVLRQEPPRARVRGCTRRGLRRSANAGEGRVMSHLSNGTSQAGICGPAGVDQLPPETMRRTKPS